MWLLPSALPRVQHIAREGLEMKILTNTRWMSKELHVPSSDNLVTCVLTTLKNNQTSTLPRSSKYNFEDDWIEIGSWTKGQLQWWRWCDWILFLVWAWTFIGSRQEYWRRFSSSASEIVDRRKRIKRYYTISERSSSRFLSLSYSKNLRTNCSGRWPFSKGDLTSFKEPRRTIQLNFEM